MTDAGETDAILTEAEASTADAVENSGTEKNRER